MEGGVTPHTLPSPFSLTMEGVAWSLRMSVPPLTAASTDNICEKNVRVRIHTNKQHVFTFCCCFCSWLYDSDRVMIVFRYLHVNWPCRAIPVLTIPHTAAPCMTNDPLPIVGIAAWESQLTCSWSVMPRHEKTKRGSDIW